MCSKKDFEFPQSDDYILRFMITGGHIYTEQKKVVSFIKEEKAVKQLIHLGLLNDGFTFFDDKSYTTRIIFNKGDIHTVELYIPENNKTDSIELNIPLLQETRFSRSNSLDSLIKSFQIRT